MSLGGVSKQLLDALAPGVNFKQSLKTNQNQHSNITRILLTGGPCAGKTTAITNISKSLGQLGIKVLVVPEAATLLNNGGADIVSSSFTRQQGLIF